VQGQVALSSLQVEVLECLNLRVQTRETYGPFSSPFSRIYVVHGGQGRIAGGKGQVCLKPGQVYLVALNAFFQYEFDPGLELVVWHMRAHLGLGADLFDGEDRVLSAALPAEWLDWNWVLGLDRADPGAVLAHSARLHCLLALLAAQCREMHPPSVRRSRHRAFYAFVEANCSAALRVADAARFLNLPASTLSKQLLRDTGVTPKDYISEKLAQRAAQELLLTDMSINEIAWALRFSDPFHFSRFFKRRTGLSPRSYREAHGRT
jgi:AraC-like DNA-binding protein